MSSIIKVGKVQSSTGQDAVTVADSGAITANGNITASGTLTTTGAITASGGIANAGTISAGTVGNNVAVQGSFGVTDISSDFTHNTGWSLSHFRAYSFNGFVFITMQASLGSTPSGASQTITTNGNSTYRPFENFQMPTVSYQGDTANFVRFSTNGEVIVGSPVNASGSYYLVVNGFYRI